MEHKQMYVLETILTEWSALWGFYVTYGTSNKLSGKSQKGKGLCFNAVKWLHFWHGCQDFELVLK